MKSFLSIFATVIAAILLVCMAFHYPQTSPALQPKVSINSYSSLVKNNEVLHCSKFKDLGVTIYYNGDMKNYDQIKIELHRFDKKDDEIVAFKKLEINLLGMNKIQRVIYL